MSGRKIKATKKPTLVVSATNRLHRVESFEKRNTQLQPLVEQRAELPPIDHLRQEVLEFRKHDIAAMACKPQQIDAAWQQDFQVLHMSNMIAC